MQYGMHICSGAYASNVKCMYTSLHSHFWLHWTQRRHIHWHRSVICGCELIIMYSLHVAFEGHISFCHVHGNNMMLMVPSMTPLHMLYWDDGFGVLYDLWCWCSTSTGISAMYHWQCHCHYGRPLPVALYNQNGHVVLI